MTLFELYSAAYRRVFLCMIIINQHIHFMWGNNPWLSIFLLLHISAQSTPLSSSP